ncbi:MAG: NAD-dependent dehydratase, partial [Gemmatimonadaceae bacterium]|nr:NAD-dependent dehydratase [Gemmatimonadaceae bacterium]
EGIVRLFHSDCVGPVNIGNPNELTIRQLAEIVLEETESTSTLDMMPMPVDDPQVRQPDISIARELLQWEATVSLREGIRSTLPYFKIEVDSRDACARTILD